MIHIASAHHGVINTELQELAARSLPEPPGTAVLLSKDPTLHDINQHYLDACRGLLGIAAAELRRDGWDKGIAESGVQEILTVVSSHELSGESLEQPARELLRAWHAALRDKLLALKKSDGCTGCFERHANSRKVESYLSSILAKPCRVKTKSFLQAAADADPAALKKNISRGVDLNMRDEQGRTALAILLRNESMHEETRRNVDECVRYLLSLDGIHLDKPMPGREGEYDGNVLALAIRHGRESAARYLLASHPGLAFRGPDGDTQLSCMGRHCPGLIDDLAARLCEQDSRTLADMYKDEIRSAGAAYLHGSRAFFCKALGAISRADFFKGQEVMRNLIMAATELKDAEMTNAAVREWHSVPQVLMGNTLDQGY
jgi:hypothetical protein